MNLPPDFDPVSDSNRVGSPLTRVRSISAVECTLPRRRRRGSLKRSFVAGLAVLFGFGVSACSVIPQASADPTRYYVLNGPGPNESSGRIATQGVALGIRTLELPNYLRSTKSMVVRKGKNEVRYEEYARWAEPIEAGLTRALKERLAEASEVRSVATFPLVGGETREFDVRIRILRCEGGTSGGGRPVALFSASYEFSKPEADGVVVLRKVFTAPEAAWDGTDFAELAQRLSDGVALLAAEIASNLPVP